MGRTRAGYKGSNAFGGCIKYFGTSVGDCVLQLNATILPVKSLIGKEILPVNGLSGLKMPKNFMPYVGNWREITPESYKLFDAFLHPDKPFTGRSSLASSILQRMLFFLLSFV